VEKILEPGERLRDWPVEGTTGYEFLNDVTRLFVDPAGEEGLTRVWEELTGERRPFAALAAEAKLEQARTTFAPEVERLAVMLLPDALAGLDLAAAVASLPVYRTYVDPARGLVADADRAAVAALPERLRAILLLEERGHDAFVIRFQQTTPAVMAKGVEDTAFYRFFRLSALNEVGGDPGVFSLPPAELHRGNLERLERFPRQLLATSTHDAKRSADVRARIAALSRFPEEWAELAHAWAPRWRDPAEGVLVLQTLVGVWPLERERLAGYLAKAAREGKRTSSWLAPDREWEDALAT
jgi:(1->4)-alpha-D-glucan 1-alpha-D-glucosylmutase